jgi:hypothetical protein
MVHGATLPHAALRSVSARMALRAARRIRHPPSRKRACIMTIAVVLALRRIAIETVIGGPDWARVEHRGGLRARP